MNELKRPIIPIFLFFFLFKYELYENLLLLFRDHAGGNADLVAQFPSKLKVLGGDDRIKALTQKVSHGDTLSVGSLKIDCLFTPCHTQGHICYHVTNTDDPSQQTAVFTGELMLIKIFESISCYFYAELL